LGVLAAKSVVLGIAVLGVWIGSSGWLPAAGFSLFVLMIAKEGIPFIAAPVVLAGVLFFFGFWVAGILIILLAAFMAFFFRDPQRVIPTCVGLIVSPADGRVTRVEDDGTTKLISVFLSPLDVHINRSPIAGMVTQIEYTSGKKSPATSDAASLSNERNSLNIEGEELTVTCTQIAGIVARRIVCWAKAGDNLKRGEKFGLIIFSSRTDLRMPAAVELMVKAGDRVKGGETVVAKIQVKNG